MAPRASLFYQIYLLYKSQPDIPPSNLVLLYLKSKQRYYYNIAFMTRIPMEECLAESTKNSTPRISSKLLIPPKLSVRYVCKENINGTKVDTNI